MIIKGQIQTFTNKGSSGLPVHRQFCVQCGSPLFDEALSAPNELAIKSGSLSVQQKEKLQPVSVSRPRSVLRLMVLPDC